MGGWGAGTWLGNIHDLRWVIIWFGRVGGGSDWYGLHCRGWCKVSVLDVECWERVLVSSSSWLMVDADDWLVSSHIWDSLVIVHICINW